MPVPDFQSCMLPLLKYIGRKGTEVSFREVLEALAKEFDLSDSDLRELLPSGRKTVFSSRVGWAKTYLKKAGLLESSRRGFYRITPRGIELLKGNPERIDIALLKRYPEFEQFLNINRKVTPTDTDEGFSPPRSPDTLVSPFEQLEEAYRQIQDLLAEEILQRLKEVTPAFFERIVVQLLVAMGYGGSFPDAGEAIGKSGDGGVDGVIKEDKLGLDAIYIQAKRWGDAPVGRPVVMQFAGALQARKANKGIFITTSVFTEEAKKYVAEIGTKIVLLDGFQLAELMIEHNVGVSTINSYHIKRIDNDFFEEED